ncbi:hypothetical protein [Actinokineospora sp. NBRC 105648]|uniref:hypothetical protein n=1 Tax=Actinokineospora sp. NBRC 105648 TaxID=3032206 RepID=UPI0025522681|nr:hypothetical protein [Actinokineospora sp. NBRC 105648]
MADVLRLAVVPAPEEAGAGFQVRVHVNGDDVTVGVGMDPYDLLVPHNRLLATAAPGRVPIGRCTCGDYGCCPTDVVVQRVGGLVLWAWSGNSATFVADQYDAEVARAVADHTWETPDRVAGRLLLAGLDRARLLDHGVTPDWVHHDERFRFALRYGADYQLFLDVEWGDHTPESLAAEIRETLARPPRDWPVSWHAIDPALRDTPPAIAGPDWKPDH